MQTITGNLYKMKVELNLPVTYSLRLSEQEIPLNAFLGKNISLTHTGLIHCIQCGRKTSKSFQQGFCYPCLRRLMECDLCMIYPEKCHVEQGTCPKNDWAHTQCYQPHIIYLANSSGLKVGITRETNVPGRWIDQGAKQAMPIFKVSNRYQAGVLEVALKQFVSDRTNWRMMLRQDVAGVDLMQERDALLNQAQPALNEVLTQFKKEDIIPIVEVNITTMKYPILQYPEKITSLSFDKTSTISGKLQGIKGQYLILDGGVINVRKFGGYEVECQLW